MRRVLGSLATAILLALVALAIYPRMVAQDPQIWHVDPLLAPDPGTPNTFRAVPNDMEAPTIGERNAVFAVAAPDLARAFDEIARSKPRTRLLAGSPEELWATYVQRSLVFGFPDYVSVKVYALGEAQSTLAVYSRSRFGKSDLGVNGTRVREWLTELSRAASAG